MVEVVGINLLLGEDGSEAEGDSEDERTEELHSFLSGKWAPPIGAASLPNDRTDSEGGGELQTQGERKVSLHEARGTADTTIREEGR